MILRFPGAPADVVVQNSRGIEWYIMHQHETGRIFSHLDDCQDEDIAAIVRGDMRVDTGQGRSHYVDL